MAAESWEEEPEPRAASWRDASETELLCAMRRGHHAAFAECYRRFAPMLARMAARRGVPVEDQTALIGEHLEDTLIPILRGLRRDPSPLGAYLAAGFRRRLVSVWRAREREAVRRRALEIVASGPVADDRHASARERERVVAEGLSEYALQAARPPDTVESLALRAHDPVREARLGLAHALTRLMTPDERQIMGQVAERYPQREIAAAFGVGASGMRMRILRLRERMAEEAARYINGLPTEDGILLAQFLATPRAHRTGAARLSAQNGAGHRDHGDERV